MRSKEADQFKDEYVSTEHLLIALSNAKGEDVARLLQSHGVTKDAILKVLVSIRGTRKSPIRIPKKNIRRCSATRAISPSLRAKASSIRSSAATKKSGA